MVGFHAKDSVGGTPTDAVETTALPEKSPMIGVPVCSRARDSVAGNGSGTLPEPAGGTPTLRGAPVGDSPTETESDGP